MSNFQSTCLASPHLHFASGSGVNIYFLYRLTNIWQHFACDRFNILCTAYSKPHKLSRETAAIWDYNSGFFLWTNTVIHLHFLPFIMLLKSSKYTPAFSSSCNHVMSYYRSTDSQLRSVGACHSAVCIANLLGSTQIWTAYPSATARRYAAVGPLLKR